MAMFRWQRRSCQKPKSKLGVSERRILLLSWTTFAVAISINDPDAEENRQALDKYNGKILPQEQQRVKLDQ